MYLCSFAFLFFIFTHYFYFSFFTLRPCKHLDRKHTIFGKIVGGADTLAAMENVPTDASDRPLVRLFSCKLQTNLYIADPLDNH